jgi:acyl-CoA thioesterase-1
MYLLKIIFVSQIFLSLFFCKNENKNEFETPQKGHISKKVIIFFGDSLTAGMGLESVEESFPNLLNEKIKTLGYDLLFINAGVSGDTTTGGLTRIDWVLSKGVDFFILELGANDMMRGVSAKIISENIENMILKVRKKNPNAKILLIPMKPFPNMGVQYGNSFEKVYIDISKKMNVSLSVFLLEKVAGNKELNQKDGIHPTKKGHEIIAETLYSDISKLLK